MGRKSKKDLQDHKPEKLAHRADVVQYWLQQQDFPKNYKVDPRMTVLDKVVLSMIEKAYEGHPASATWLMENGFGKNTENIDSSVSGGMDIGAGFNVAGNVEDMYNKLKDEESYGDKD